ncbi:hypothetical protein PMAYCL1PPCAC_06078, partial [Pristionchus mayeri]
GSTVSPLNRPKEFDRIDDSTLMILEYSEIHAILDSIVNGLCMDYPELHPGDDEKMILMKREITYFYTLPNDEKAKIFAGAPCEFKYLSIALKKLMPIGRALKPLNDAEQQHRRANLDQYAMFKLCFPLCLKHLDERKAFYKRSGMTRAQIQKDIGRTALEYIDKWHKDDPNKKLIEESKVRTRAKYGL